MRAVPALVLAAAAAAAPAWAGTGSEERLANTYATVFVRACAATAPDPDKVAPAAEALGMAPIPRRQLRAPPDRPGARVEGWGAYARTADGAMGAAVHLYRWDEAGAPAAACRVSGLGVSPGAMERALAPLLAGASRAAESGAAGRLVYRGSLGGRDYRVSIFAGSSPSGPSVEVVGDYGPQ